jgi:hypothetical protein
MLKPGREYRPKLTIWTDAGIMRPELLFRRSWPWIIIEAAVIVAVIAITLFLR